MRGERVRGLTFEALVGLLETGGFVGEQSHPVKDRGIVVGGDAATTRSAEEMLMAMVALNVMALERAPRQVREAA
ncbi:hypothetical protein [Stenotrophomonas maltophilia]|uniref:hypothetical protein n=1 Tax=Stenotrophomonas maltophilia TaxID=40324 RepID=UPI0009A1FD18|nr:hypothetical protein [Stenotrophomonas maltophilia]